MYELTVETEFCAAHAIVLNGEREPLHGHNFRVRVGVEADGLDGEGLAVDFHAVESAVRAVVSPWANRNLNECPPFDTLNPTAELIARTIWELVDARLRLDRGRVAWVSVSEATGCTARFIAPRGM